MERLNGVMEDVGGAIGYTAASALAAWFSGAHLYIPGKADPEHPVAKLIGIAAFKRLVQEFGGEILCLPDGRQEMIDRRDRQIAILVWQGKDSVEIAKQTGLTRRRVQQIVAHLKDTGIIHILVEAACDSMSNTLNDE